MNDNQIGKLLSLPITDLYALKKDAENKLKNKKIHDDIDRWEYWNNIENKTTEALTLKREFIFGQEPFPIIDEKERLKYFPPKDPPPF